MKKQWIALGVIILTILGYWGYSSFDEGINGSEVFKVQRQDLDEVISEIGKVVPVKEVDMTFPLSGKVAQVSVIEGQSVSKGDTLIQLNTAKVKANLASSQAAVQEAQSRLDRAYVGSTIAEIRVSETAVANAQNTLDKTRTAVRADESVAESAVDASVTTLANAKKLLADQENKSTEGSIQAYEDALDTLQDTNTKADTTAKTIDYIQEQFFSGSSSEDRAVKNSEKAIDDGFLKVQPFIDAAIISDSISIDTALSEMLTYLNQIADELAIIRSMMDEKFSISPSVTETGYVDAERTSINTGISSLTTALQAVSSASLDGGILLNKYQADIDAAEATLAQAEANLASVRSQGDSQIVNAEGALDLAQSELQLKRSGPTKQDVALYKAQLNQAIAYSDLIRQDLVDSTIYAPTNGIITNVYTEVGELATLSFPVLSMIAEEQYEIESYISELDIPSIDVGDEAEITFDAFGEGRVFIALVTTVNPYETMIDGDIFYKITLELNQYDQGIRSGMTANIKVLTAEKDEVLVIPSRYIGDVDGKKFVKVTTGGVDESGEENYELIEIATGVRGIDLTEVTSGLKEGEKIIPYY